jgi:hypothetical protein
MENVAVPFKADRYGDSYTSQITTNGVLRAEHDAVVIEFRDTVVDWTTMASQAGDIHSVRIPFADVESVTVTRKWPWSPRLTIRTRTLAALAGYPIATANQCTFKVKRSDHERARELAIGVSLHLANEEMRRLGESSE